MDVEESRGEGGGTPVQDEREFEFKLKGNQAMSGDEEDGAAREEQDMEEDGSQSDDGMASPRTPGTPTQDPGTPTQDPGSPMYSDDPQSPGPGSPLSWNDDNKQGSPMNYESPPGSPTQPPQSPLGSPGGSEPGPESPKEPQSPRDFNEGNDENSQSSAMDDQPASPKEPQSPRSPEVERSRSVSPAGSARSRSRSGSPQEVARSRSVSPQEVTRSRSGSPQEVARSRSVSPAGSGRSRSRSGSPAGSARSRSGSPARSRSGSPARSRSGSPAKSRSRSPAGSARSRSGSPARSRSGSPAGSARSRSGSPAGSARSRSRSGSKGSRSRSRSPAGSARSRSGSPAGSARSRSGSPPRSRSRSGSPAGSARSRSGSPAGSARSRSGSPARSRSRSGSPAGSARSRSRSGSPAGSARSRSRSGSRARSRSRSGSRASGRSRSGSPARSRSRSRSSSPGATPPYSPLGSRGSGSPPPSPAGSDRNVEKKDESDKEDLVADIFGESDDEEEFEGFEKADMEATASKKEKKKTAILSDDEDEGGATGVVEENTQPLPSMSDDENDMAARQDGQDGEFVSDFELMMMKKKDEQSKQRRKRKEYDIINDSDDLIADMIGKMKVAAEEDRGLNMEKKPAIKKLQYLGVVVSQLKKADLHSAFLDCGILGAMTEWLAPLPDKSLPNLQIRQAFLKQLSEFPSINPGSLKTSGIGKAIMYLYKHPKEVKDNRERAGKLINEWSRPLFNLTSNYKSLSKEEREQRDYDQLPKRRRTSMEEGGMTPRKDLDKSLSGEQKALRPGDPGWVYRARVPMPSNKDYVIRPKWKTEEEGMEPRKAVGKKQPSKYEKQVRKFAEKKKNAKALRAVPISIEGRNMAL